VLGSGRSGSLGIDDASAHVASTFLITSAGSDAGDEGSAGVTGAFANSAASGAKKTANNNCYDFGGRGLIV
jgi:hypothetical protein